MGRRPGGPENKMEATAMNDISKNIRYAGVNDHAVDLFEGQYKVPGGMSYNSYVILDEKTAVLDTVDAHFTDEWLRNVAAALDGRQPDYLIVHHMEPDHSANIAEFLKVYPQATVVATAKALAMMGEFFEGLDLTGRTLAAANGGTLSLGAHELNFVFAPMVHWPEVMFSYESSEKVLFSADGFGKFGALDVEEDWVPEARRYYIGIVGKYGVQVQNVLKKAAALDIAAIVPLHGPVLRGDLGLYLEKYNAWSSYTPEEDGILVAYTSVYGHTKAAAELLAQTLAEKGAKVPVVLCDLARADMSSAVADAFRYSKLVLATTTYNGDVFPFMREFLDHLAERNFQKRAVGLIENGAWAPMAAKVMQGKLAACKELQMLEPVVTVRSALNDASRAQVAALADALLA